MKFIFIISVGDVGSETDDFFLSQSRDNGDHNGVSCFQLFSQVAQKLINEVIEEFIWKL